MATTQPTLPSNALPLTQLTCETTFELDGATEDIIDSMSIDELAALLQPLRTIPSTAELDEDPSPRCDQEQLHLDPSREEKELLQESQFETIEMNDIHGTADASALRSQNMFSSQQSVHDSCGKEKKTIKILKQEIESIKCTLNQQKEMMQKAYNEMDGFKDVLHQKEAQIKAVKSKYNELKLAYDIMESELKMKRPEVAENKLEGNEYTRTPRNHNRFQNNHNSERLSRCKVFGWIVY